MVHISKEKYLKWSGLTWGEFQERREKQGIKYEFF
jgi:hypothetical protein